MWQKPPGNKCNNHKLRFVIVVCVTVCVVIRLLYVYMFYSSREEWLCGLL